MLKCSICSLISRAVRRAMCMSSRRNSGDTIYQELSNANIMEKSAIPKNDTSSTRSTGSCCNTLMENDDKTNISGSNYMGNVTTIVDEIKTNKQNTNIVTFTTQNKINGIRFLTLHKKRRKKLTCSNLLTHPALLDDLYNGQVQCLLNDASNWKFNVFNLDLFSGGHSLPVLCVHLFNVYGLIDFFRLDIVSLWKLFKLIEDGYHSTNPYHNSIHATDVTQAMHCFLQQKKILEYLNPLEIMASIIGSVSHDLDHPGVNQPFLIATCNHLALLYNNTSVLENHHYRSAVGCLLESGIAEQIDDDIRPLLYKQISSLILATDITRQGEFIKLLHERVKNNSLNMKEFQHRQFILEMALKCADISNPCRPWEISKIWSQKVCEEFFQQGDRERKLKLPVSILCDRNSNSIPKIQMDFFKYIVTPLYMEWHLFLNTILSTNIIDILNFNRRKWEEKAKSILMDQTNTFAKDADASLVDDGNIRLKRKYSLNANSLTYKSSTIVVGDSSSNLINTSMTSSFRRKLNRKRGSLPIITNSSSITSPTKDTSTLLDNETDFFYFIDDVIPSSFVNTSIRDDYYSSKYLCRQQTFPPVQQQPQQYFRKNQNHLNTFNSFLKKHRSNISPSFNSLNEADDCYYNSKAILKQKKIIESQKENFDKIRKTSGKNDRRSSVPIITSKIVQKSVFLRRKSLHD